MRPEPDEAEIRQRVTRRYRARFRFLVHVFLTLPVIVVSGMIGMMGESMPEGFRDKGPMFAAAALFMAWICSVMIHFVWLVFHELSERAIQHEIDRQWQLTAMVYEKPKRGASRLTVMSDDGELSDLLGEDVQNASVTRR